MKYQSILSIFACTCLMITVTTVHMKHIERKNPPTLLTALAEDQSTKNLPTIIIDPGHGGVDGGASGNGLVEKDINLSISLNLRDLLWIQGFRVIMTREDDRSLHDEGIISIAQQKRSDLHHRLALMENHPEAIFISIHQNKFQQPSSKGAQIFYSQNLPESKQLAQSLQESFIKYLQPENQRQIKGAENNLFLLYEAKIPAIMAECGFLSNPEEAGKLASEQYRQEIAFVIYQGLLDYLSERNR